MILDKKDINLRKHAIILEKTTSIFKINSIQSTLSKN